MWARLWGWIRCSSTTWRNLWRGGIARQISTNDLKSKVSPATASRQNCFIHWYNKSWAFPGTCHSMWVALLSPVAPSQRWYPWKMPAWQNVLLSSGTRKTSSLWDCSRWIFWPWACCLPFARAYRWYSATAPTSKRSATSPKTTRPLTACCKLPIPLAYSRSSHGRRCLCYRGSNLSVSTIWSFKSLLCALVLFRAIWCTRTYDANRGWNWRPTPMTPSKKC